MQVQHEQVHFYYPRGASNARVFVVIVCLCVSVTRLYCIKTAKRRITQTTPRDRLSRHVTHLKFLVPLRYLWNGLS